MKEPVYKIIDVVGTSTEGSDQAIQNAIGRASKTLHHLEWYEVVESRGRVQSGKVVQYQVSLRVGFRLED